MVVGAIGVNGESLQTVGLGIAVTYTATVPAPTHPLQMWEGDVMER